MSLRLKAAVIGIFLCASMGLGRSDRVGAAVQTNTGVIVDGTIVDERGGVIPGATVTLSQSVLARAMTVTDGNGRFRFTGVKPGQHVLTARLDGFLELTRTVDVATEPVHLSLVLVVSGIAETISVSAEAPDIQAQSRVISRQGRYAPFADTASYARLEPNRFMPTSADPLSTFAADVDTASYSNVRRFLRAGQWPPVDAVRIEELINYFRFRYPGPNGSTPLSITTEIGDCPWARGHRLALIGLKAKAIDDHDVKPRNIVLLLDVSGSMAPRNRLPLIKEAMRMFVDTLREPDRLSIVVYAGASGLALPPTRGSERERMREALENLEAGGSTNGAAGIELAYRVAREQFIRGGVNRVILATDGDFNVGVTGQGDLVRLIEREREGGVFLSVLGVGDDNLKDSTMEQLADKGNGHYAYLDTLQEARRVLVAEGGATLETVAKDVKFQVEFNPARVAAWKLIGYEDRQLAKEDFNDDRKDAGEVGAGHTVTALYEIVPVGASLPEELRSHDGRSVVDPLVYQTAAKPVPSRDLFTLKVRYKQPMSSQSELVTRAVREGGRSSHLAFAAAVAEFGMLLRQESQGSGSQWDALGRRVNTMPVIVDATDHDDFATLVAEAARLRGR